MRENIGSPVVRTDGRAYGHVITKFSRMGRLPHFLTHGAPQARFARQSSAIIGSLSNNVFERRTSTGSGLFSFFDGGFAQIFSQIASITVKKLRNTNFISSRHVKRENTSLPVDVRRSKTSLLKLPIG